MKYRINDEVFGYTVEYKKYWFTPWRYCRRPPEGDQCKRNTLIWTFKSRSTAQKYIDQELDKVKR